MRRGSRVTLISLSTNGTAAHALFRANPILQQQLMMLSFLAATHPALPLTLALVQKPR
jgi:hypothetical protein